MIVGGEYVDTYTGDGVDGSTSTCCDDYASRIYFQLRLVYSEGVCAREDIVDSPSVAVGSICRSPVLGSIIDQCHHVGIARFGVGEPDTSGTSSRAVGDPAGNLEVCELAAALDLESSCPGGKRPRTPKVSNQDQSALRA